MLKTFIHKLYRRLSFSYKFTKKLEKESIDLKKMSTGNTNPQNRNIGITRAFEFVKKSQIKGDYYEFGVYKGASLINAYKASQLYNSDCQFYAFDSFKGSPQLEKEEELQSYTACKQGLFQSSLEDVKDNLVKINVDIKRFHFIKGFYNESLKDNKTKSFIKTSSVSIAHIDCDLESSARDVLKFLEDRLVDGALLVFDDWFLFRGRKDKGVKKAFLDWQKQSKWEATEYYKYSWAGIVFIVNS